MSGTYSARETLTVTSSTAVGFTPGTYGTARGAFVVVEGGAIRYWLDNVSSDPTPTIGLLAPVGSRIYLTSKDQLVKFEAIAVGVDATLSAVFGY